MTFMRDSDRGFSFIELLAYMAIAALLILAAIPQFNNYRGQARDRSTVSDVVNVATAMEAWSISHPGEAFPSLRYNFRGDTWGMDILQGLGVTLTPGTSLYVMDRFEYPGDRSVALPNPMPGQAFCILASNLDGKQYNHDNPMIEGRLAYFSASGGLGADCYKDR